jgi:GNAT superfamily N-acetyltransferase
MRTLPSLDPMGTVRVYRKESGVYRLGRLAVLKDYRKFGFGRDLVARLHEWVKADAEDRLNAPSADVVAHSQVPVIGFYKACGFF